MLNECNGCEYQCNLSHIDICTLGSPCPHQRSTPMTNEEWFCGLSTEEKARFFDKICYSAWGDINSRFRDMADYTDWVEWLKQPHNS